MQELYTLRAKFERFGRLMDENLFISIGQSRNELVCLSAEQRSLNLIKAYPNIAKRIQIQHIATYLGVHPQSLSRIFALCYFCVVGFIFYNALLWKAY